MILFLYIIFLQNELRYLLLILLIAAIIERL